MSAYYITPDAQADLIDIRQYTLQQWGKQQSQNYLLELRQTIRLLAKTPSLGKSRSDVGTGVLSFPHASHTIYYIEPEHGAEPKHDAEHKYDIVVFAILHQRMLPSQHLTERNV